MKKTIYGFIAILGLNILAYNVVPGTCYAAGFGEDSFDFVKKVNVVGTDNNRASSSLLDTISSTINWILGILATIALCICMYAGFKMLTSGGDSKSYDAGWTILKNAAIGLAIIGLSWIIVSAIFWFINLQGGEGDLGGTNEVYVSS